MELSQETREELIKALQYAGIPVEAALASRDELFARMCTHIIWRFSQLYIRGG